MVYNSGTGITDQVDMLDKLIEVVTSRNLTAVAVNAGGTGHVVGDIIGITATGSTSTIVAQLEATTVSSGVITGIRIYRGGAYTVDPTTTTGNAQSSTTGAGTGATFDLTFSAASWAVNRRSQEAVSATIAGGGTGYTVSDQITLVGGVVGHDGSVAVFNVDSVSSGVITGVSVVSATRGNYEEVPANPVSVTGGTGSGATLTVTWGDPPQTRQDGQIAMLQGEGLGGTDEIHIAIKTYTQVNGFDNAYNWSVMGLTNYNSLLPLHQQVGINTSQINTSTGALPASLKDIAGVVLKNNDANPDMSWWINHNGRRIILVAKVQGSSNVMYASMYAGFLNQTATDTEYPYPLWVCGNTSEQNRVWTNTSDLTGGIVEVISDTTVDPAGPGYLLTPAGSWTSFASEISSNSSSRDVETEFCVYPIANPVGVSGSGQTVNIGSAAFASGTSMIPTTSVPGTPSLQLKPTPGSGDDYYWLVAPIVMRKESSQFPSLHNMYGEIDGVFWFHTGNNVVVSEDRFEFGTNRHTIFANGNRTQVWSYFALSED